MEGCTTRGFRVKEDLPARAGIRLLPSPTGSTTRQAFKTTRATCRGNLVDELTELIMLNTAVSTNGRHVAGLATTLVSCKANKSHKTADGFKIAAR